MSTAFDHDYDRYDGPAGEGGDLPAQQLQAEQAALGACLGWPQEAVPLLLQHLRAEHFWRPAHQAIYTAIAEMFADGESIDPITLAAVLERRGELHKVGGPDYLHRLLACVQVYTPGAHQDWCELVVDAYAQRTVSAVSQGLGALAQTRVGGRAEVERVLEHAQERIAAAQADLGVKTQESTLIGGLLDGVLDEIQQVQAHGPVKGVMTGFADLDAVTGGLHPGEMVVVAGRPGIGKSVLLVDIARHAAIRGGVGTVVFSLEMGRSELVRRILSAEARVRATDLGRKGGMCEEDWERIQARLAQIIAAPLHIVDTPNMTITSIKARAREIAAQREIGLIAIDYLQLIESTARAESRQIEVSEISRKLKLLAKELNVPVVVAAQLNRGPEQRVDKKPVAADLRESGALEADADKIILIHRPDAYEREDPRMGEADFILAKHRGGPTATITVAHQLHYSRFVDMARQDDPTTVADTGDSSGVPGAGAGNVVPLNRADRPPEERAGDEWPTV